MRKAAASMLISGDVIDVDLGFPEGREAGFPHTAVVITAKRTLRSNPTVVQVVPLTSTVRERLVEVTLIPGQTNGLDHPSNVQCQHLRSINAARIISHRGNVGSLAVTQIREIIGVLLDIFP